jgi:hypothetical protein
MRMKQISLSELFNVLLNVMHGFHPNEILFLFFLINTMPTKQIC